MKSLFWKELPLGNLDPELRQEEGQLPEDRVGSHPDLHARQKHVHILRRAEQGLRHDRAV